MEMGINDRSGIKGRNLGCCKSGRDRRDWNPAVRKRTELGMNWEGHELSRVAVMGI